MIKILKNTNKIPQPQKPKIIKATLAPTKEKPIIRRNKLDIVI